ncbi:MAG: sodium:proton antiporter, partial [Clostridiales bacterium]|nr:sodium:proton antiporter [Clostridiales bacterium]
IMVASGIVTVIFRKLKQPAVLGYILAGFLISPNFEYLPTVVDHADITTLADIGVIFLMFGLGLEFSFKKLAQVGGSAFTVAATVMAMMILVGAGIGSLLGWGKMDCIFLGGMISMSSTMIILKSYEEYNLMREQFAQMVLGALVFEDVAGIFMLAVLSTISVGQNASGPALAQQILIMVIYLVVWILIGVYLIPSILKRISGLLNDELILIVSAALCLLMVVIANLIGFSSALGAFLAGSILAGTIQSERIRYLVKPVKDLFGAIFFVSVGMMIVPSMLIEYIVPIIIITIVVIIGQMTFSVIGILLSGQSLRTAIRGGFSMMQIGEFSFIVATLGMSFGVISNFLYPIIVCVSVITAFATPFFIKGSEPFYKFLDKKLPNKVKAALRRNTSESQTRDAHDKDWNQYIKNISIRTGACSSILFLFYWAGIRYLMPEIRGAVGSAFAGNAISAAIIITLMLPVINVMFDSNTVLFYKLWVKHRSNHLPLITMRALRTLIAACFIALVLRKIFHIPFIILVLIAVIPMIFIIRSAWLNGVTIAMEKRFIANFSQRTLDKAKKDRTRHKNYRWLDESLYVVEFEIIDPDFKKTIIEFTKRRDFVVTIIRIIRKDSYVNMPSADEIIQYGDILQMIGTWDEVDACTLLLEKDDAIKYTDSDDKTLKDFMYGQRFEGVPEEGELVCVPIKLDGDSKFIRKSIKNCGLRQAFGATIIGIERGALPIVSPDINTVLAKDDIVWMIGGEKMVSRLIRSGLMDA